VRSSTLWLGTLLCIAPAVWIGPAAEAQNWPTRPLRFEVVGSPGGLPDTVARALTTALPKSLDVPMVVENRPGAGGNIAAGVVAKATPDGHTFLVTGTNYAVNPMLLPDPGFDYVRDLAPVSMTVAAKSILVAAPSLRANDINDVIAVAKQKPKAVSIAIGEIGTPSHLAAEMLAQYRDVDLTFVPYGGFTQAVPDVMADRVDLAVGAISTGLPLVHSGKLKALAMISPQRSPLAPDIPTTAEAGFPELQIDNWICIVATGGTPAPIIDRLDEEIAKALQLPEVRDMLAKQGVEIFHLNPAQLDAFLKSESSRFAKLLEHSRVKRAAP